MGFLDIFIKKTKRSNKSNVEKHAENKTICEDTFMATKTVSKPAVKKVAAKPAAKKPAPAKKAVAKAPAKKAVKAH